MRSLDGMGWETYLLVPRGMEISTGSRGKAIMTMLVTTAIITVELTFMRLYPVSGPALQGSSH